MLGYERMRKSETGAIELSRGSVAMGTHLILKGEQLEIARDDNFSDIEVLNLLNDYSGKPSRIDAALDVWSNELNPSSLWERWENKQVKTHSRKAKRFTSLVGEGTDDGFYIGTRTSDRYMRVYNKGRQLGTNDDWTRLEVECKKVRARAIMYDMMKLGDVSGVTRQTIKEVANFDDEAFRMAIASVDIPLQPIARKESNFTKWLKKQVAPAIARRIKQFPEENTIDFLMSLIDEELKDD